MSATNAPAVATAAKLTVADYLDGQLAMFARRCTPEERAEIRWWRDRLAHLAKQAPRAEPVPASSSTAA
jgi:hypothetical protein